MEALQTGLAFGAVGAIFIAIILIYLIPVIAAWKLFKKAGIAGWKSLVPIYNIYLVYKMSGMSGFWVIPEVLVITFQSIAEAGVVMPDWMQYVTIAVGIIALIGNIMRAIKLPKAFGKGIGYTIGLIIIPEIMEIVLGFGKAEYQGDYKE